jgi:hypothetical protein
MIWGMLQPAADELWRLTSRGAEIDPEALKGAVEAALSEPTDFRTRLLIRDSIRAIEGKWGEARTQAWLRSLPFQAQIDDVQRSTAEVAAEDAFPSLKGRIVTPTKPDDVKMFLREVSTLTKKPTDIYIGGSIALILAGHLSRHTEDIDLVDEVPAALREDPAALDRLAQRYGLRLTHFQSHYLPSGWKNRIESIGVFGSLRAFAVSESDVFLSKLFSSRERDRDDLRMLAPKLDRNRIIALMQTDANALLGEQKLRDAAEKNWFILFGESLPVA